MVWCLFILKMVLNSSLVNGVDGVEYIIIGKVLLFSGLT